MLKNATKVLSIVVALTFVVGAFAVMATAGAQNAPQTKSSSKAATEDIILDVDAAMAKKTIDLSTLNEYGSNNVPMAYEPGNIYNINDSARFYTTTYGKAYYTTGSNYMWFTKVAENNFTEVWIANDTTYMPGDPRNAYPDQYNVSRAQAQYMADTFANIIYPNDTAFMGAPPQNDGVNSVFNQLGRPYFGTNVTGRTMIMIYNIVDEQFFNDSYPYRIAGFYWSYLDSIYDRNIINIDTKLWDNLTGPQPPLANHTSYLYEGVVTHEFMHLLQNNDKPGEQTWVMEGFADFSERIWGIDTVASHIQSFLATPDNSLTLWNDQGDINNLADYGAAVLFVFYMYDHTSLDTMQRVWLNNTFYGIAGINYALEQTGFSITYDQLFKNWRLANLIHSDTPGRGLYNYKSLDLASLGTVRIYDYSPFEGAVTSAAEFFGNTTTAPDRWGVIHDTGTSLLNQYGTDYIEVVPGVIAPVSWAEYLDSFELKFGFDGQDTATVDSWEMVNVTSPSGNQAWWSGTPASEIDRQLRTTLDLRGMETATLSFDTWWSIEDTWDFGFVQVSTDGVTWTSLSNNFTTSEHDPSAYPAIIANLPGLTGESGGWVHMSFDLSEFAGQVVSVQFRYMTDWATELEGWYVNNVTLNGQQVSDLKVVYPDINWYVSLYFPGTYVGDVYYLPVILNLNLNDITETTIRTLDTYTVYNQMFILVSPTNGPADYGFNFWNGGLWEG